MVALALVAVLAGCTADDATKDPDGPWDTMAERPCPPENILSWENFGDPFVTSWCTGCHSSDLVGEESRREAPPEINFDDHEQVEMFRDVMWLRAADHNREMPPAGGPGFAERTLFGEWLACGAPTQEELDW
jgi:hypothetical protein